MSVAVNIVKAYLNRQTMVIPFYLIFFGFFHDTIILLAKIAQGESNEKKRYMQKEISSFFSYTIKILYLCKVDKGLFISQSLEKRNSSP